MWYCTWILGVALAVVFAAMSALWFENQADNQHNDRH